MGILSGGIYRGISATNNLIFLAVSDNGVYGIPPAMAIFIEGSLEVKLPTIWTDGKAEVGRVREEKRREEERRSEKRKSQKKEDVGARKGRKVAEHCVFPMICGSHGSKSRLAKVAGAEPSGQMRDEKLHAVVARSRFRGQNAQNTSAPEHVQKLRCRKIARRCGAKQISKSKRTKHTNIGPLLEVEMSKQRTPLWREAHFHVKTCKARAPCQKWAKRWCFVAYFQQRWQAWGIWRGSGKMHVAWQAQYKRHVTTAAATTTTIITTNNNIHYITQH